MSTRHVTEAELARDVRAILDDVSRGVEIAIDRDSRTVAVLKAPAEPGRPIDECIAILRAYGSKATLDPEFADDLREIIAGQQPFEPPAWEYC